MFRAVDVTAAALSELEVEGVDAVVERLGEDREYQLLRNGRRWRVVERRYAVFPQQSGHMTVRPLEFSGRIVTRRSTLGLDIFAQSMGRPVALRSESVTLKVREPPDSFTGPWLPASELTLAEAWPQNGEIEIGEPITRTLTVKARGLSAAQLPELNASLPESVRSYPEQPQLRDIDSESGILGERVERTAIIATRPGAVTLPEVRVAWWNVDKQQPELATLPGRVFEVVVRAGTAAPDREADPAGRPRVAADSAAAPAEGGAVREPWWRWLSLGLGLAWLTTLAMWSRERRRAATPPASDRAAPRPELKPALSALRSACDAGNAPGARDALLAWGAVRWPESPPRNLTALAARCGEPLSASLNSLERVLYAGERTWDGAALYERVAAFKAKPGRGRARKVIELEPMYRS